MLFQRYSVGLNPVKQKDNKRAPAPRGFWAFPWPYFEWYFVSGQVDSWLPSERNIPKEYSLEHINKLYEQWQQSNLRSDYDLWDESYEGRDRWISKHTKVKIHKFWFGGEFYSVLDHKGHISHDWMSGKGPWIKMTPKEFVVATNKYLSDGIAHGYHSYYSKAFNEVDLSRASRDYLEVFIPA